MRLFKTLIVVMLVVVLSACSSEQTGSHKLTVAVSVVPQATFVKAVAGDLVDVVTMVPPGASPSNYQPSPKELTAFGDASIYFTIGVPTEAANILPNVASGEEDLIIVDLGHHVDEVYPARYFADEHEDDHGEEHADDHDDHDDEHADDHEDHDHAGRDPHIWMSPKRVIIMVDEIVEALSATDPSNAATYEANAEAYKQELTQLDADMKALFSSYKNASFIIMHPSLGYFADDYGLTMVAIEQDGKEASSAHMQRVIDYAKEHDIHVVLFQKEFDSTQAKTIAEELKGEALEFEPLSSDYISNMRILAETFERILN